MSEIQPLIQRGVRLITAGGTIGMTGEHAAPDTDAGWLEDIEGLGPLEVEHLRAKASVEYTLNEIFALATHASACASDGTAVVVTHGTDTMEEVAFLCDLLYAGELPIIFTGAMRPASALSADGPTNLWDAVVAARSTRLDGLGVIVCFGGELHAARFVSKSDATSPAAFSSPRLGPIGYIREGEVSLLAHVERMAPIPAQALSYRVEIVPASAGSDGGLVEAAAGLPADGMVVVTMGGGHLPPTFLEQVAIAANSIPVIACTRPSRGSILRSTYGFVGAERDLRASGAICAGALAPSAARMKLLACLGAGLTGEKLEAAFAKDDG